MKSIYILSISIIVIFIATWVNVSSIKPNDESVNTILSQDINSNELLIHSVEKLVENVNILSQHIENMSASQGKILDLINHGDVVLNSIDTEKANISSDFDTIMTNAAANPEWARENPPVFIVNPTNEESERFEILNAQLDDPGYLMSLNLAEFAQQSNVSTLPKALKMVLVSKVIKQYNSGMINKNSFIGPN